jgi:hypothetical protein
LSLRTQALHASRTLGKVRTWLQKDHASVFAEQAHTRQGTPERAYWHHGYLMALTDLLSALGKLDVKPKDGAAPYGDDER